MSTDATVSSEPIPREPSAYRPTNHFRDRFRNAGDGPNRHLDGEIVRRCIEDGDAREVHPGVYWFQATVAGVTYRLVVNADKRTVVTGYPIAVNTEVARASGRWSSRQLEDIHEFITTDPGGR